MTRLRPLHGKRGEGLLSRDILLDPLLSAPLPLLNGLIVLRCIRPSIPFGNWLQLFAAPLRPGDFPFKQS